MKQNDECEAQRRSVRSAQQLNYKCSCHAGEYLFSHELALTQHEGNTFDSNINGVAES
jgi:hypothetical protein